ncbi:hypothetical protein [Prevotella sp.]|uniref:hypothetical protein n=1 Tax=Prevotella sp. TaxID=59823 RepID=UPI003F81890B
MNDLLTLFGQGSVGGGIVVSKLIDYFVPFELSPQGKLFKAQKEWQNEMEEKRMSFQWKIESQRMRFQEKLEEKREELQKYLQDNQIEANREIALFQARAMRQTQMLLAQKHAQDTLQDHLLQDALRTFPLNVSPLVLLKNQSQPLGHLLAFSDSNADSASTTSIEQVYEEVEAIRKHPDALNIFVAPVHIDSKIKNRKVLSDQIWDTVYQRIESFFTLNYNRSGEHPVIFYPTAWNDKYNPGMHAAETLHYFLKDLPCVVIEPRFDDTTFRMMFSTWGLGYNSTLHHRTELSFPINIDAVLAWSAYERSLKALDAIKEIDGTLDINEYGFGMKKKELERNIDLFQALHIEERMKGNRMQEIEALGIYNIFKIEPVQDLAILADYMSARIGLNLAVLADIHHLRSYDRDPILPKLLKPNFPSLYADKSVREQLFKEYENSYVWLRREEIEFNGMKEIRGVQLANVKKQLDLVDSSEMVESVTEMTCNYVKKRFNIDAKTLIDAINSSIDLWEPKDISFFQSLSKVDEVANNRRLYRRIDTKIFDLQQQMKE